MLQVGGKKPEQAGIGQSFRQENVGELAGIARIADLQQVLADAGMHCRHIGAVQPCQPARQSKFDGQPGERLQAPPKRRTLRFAPRAMPFSLP